MWQLSRQVFEIRFKDRALFWDRSGQITSRVLEVIPRAEVADAEPGEVILRSPKDGVTIKFGTKLANIAQEVEDASATKFVTFAEAVILPLVQLIEVGSLTRIGNRVFYRHYFKQREEAEEFVVKLAAARGIGTNLFSKSEDPRLTARRISNFSLRLDDQVTSIRIEVAQGHQSLNVSPTIDKLIPQVVPRTRHFVHIDLDIFTRSPVARELLNVSELLNGNKKLIETRILPIFNV